MSQTNAPMPVRGEHAAPFFDRTKPRQITRYFEDLELLFKRSAVASDKEKKEFAVRYVDFDTEQLWKTVPEFVNAVSTYAQFKDTILLHYPNAGSNYTYSLRDLDSLTGDQYRTSIHSTNDLSDYHMQFMAITNWLIGKNRLGPLEQQRAYIRGFNPAYSPRSLIGSNLSFPINMPTTLTRLQMSATQPILYSKTRRLAKDPTLRFRLLVPQQ